MLAREIVTQLETRGYHVVRIYTGHMMTSLEMAGILISLLKVKFGCIEHLEKLIANNFRLLIIQNGWIILMHQQMLLLGLNHSTV